jgi:hypothetical protein
MAARRLSWWERPGQFFAVVGGMRADLYSQFPGERRDFRQMAFILFCTALEAFLSGAFAINMAFETPRMETIDGLDTIVGWDRLPMAVLVTAGFVWAFIIFNIDRHMVLGMEGMHGRELVGPTILRVILAFTIGIVMSTPLTLQLFNSEIQDQLTVMGVENSTRGTAQIDLLTAQRNAADAAWGKNKDEIEELENETFTFQNNPVYTGALDAKASADEKCQSDKARANQELYGQLPVEQGGTGLAGDGEHYWDLVDVAKESCKMGEDAAAHVTTVKVSLQTAFDNNASERDKRLASARETGAALEEAVKQANAALNQARATAERAQGSQSYGLLTRLEALWRISFPPKAASVALPSTDVSASPEQEGTPTTEATAPPDAAASVAPSTTAAEEDEQEVHPLSLVVHIAIMALLLFIELLPVVFKAIKQWPRQPTAYEAKWRQQDLDTVAHAITASEYSRAAFAHDAYAPVLAAKDMQERQKTLNEYINGEIVRIQKKLMCDQLAAWAGGNGWTDYTPKSRPVPGPSTSTASEGGSGNSGGGASSGQSARHRDGAATSEGPAVDDQKDQEQTDSPRAPRPSGSSREGLTAEGRRWRDGPSDDEAST